MKIQRREPYDKNHVMYYKDFEEFFIPELEIGYCKGAEIPTVSSIYNDYRVWLLFAEFEGKGWTCLQVAHSKKNVKEEIEVVLEHLSKRWDRSCCELTDSQFYKCVCPVSEQGEDYRDILYRKIGNEGRDFKICVLNVDKYLGLKKVEKKIRMMQRES